MIQEDLNKLGLTDNEIKVYLALVKTGETPVGGIINDLKIHRQIVYNALDSLENRGMVAKTLRNRVSHYKISDPEIILENIKKQEVVAKRVMEGIEQEIKKDKKENVVEIYEGTDNIRRFFINKFKSLPEDCEFLILASYANKFEEVLGIKFFRGEYNNLRKKKHIFSRHLTSKRYGGEMKTLLKNIKNDQDKLREMRYLPFDLENPVTTTIYPDSVTYQIFFQNPQIIEIKNPELVKSYQQYFEALWEMSK